MRVFLAAPFTSALQPNKDRPALLLSAPLLEFLQGMESELRGMGHDVFTAHRIEEYGARLRPGNICCPLDFIEVMRADCVVAFAQGSYGVHTELGWATALGKPVIWISTGWERSNSPLLHGLASFANCQAVEVNKAFPALGGVNDEAVVKLCDAISKLKIRRSNQRAVAFLSTAFGFGPVSKAMTIAKELRQRAPEIELHFFGGGLDLEFVSKEIVFDRLFRFDVDDGEMLEHLVDSLRLYDHVVSVMNFQPLQWWTKSHPPISVVDSLTWMWSELPDGLDKAMNYFVQDYLVPDDRLQEWSRRVNLIPVEPICARGSGKEGTKTRDSRRLLVNFSGCANPLADDSIYEEYVIRLSSSIVAAARDNPFDEIIFCCREGLHAAIHAEVGGHIAYDVAHFAHGEFIDLMAGATLIITSPGLTTTVEALQLGKPLGFLLPQNYSQSLVAEANLELFGDSVNMAFSKFGREFVVPAGLPEAEGVAHATKSMSEICRTREFDIDRLLAEMLKELPQLVVERSREGMKQGVGQHEIVEKILSELRPSENRQNNVDAEI